MNLLAVRCFVFLALFQILVHGADEIRLQHEYLDALLDETNWDTYERVKATDMNAEDFSRLLVVDNAAGDQAYTGTLLTTGCYKSRANGGWGFCGPTSCVSLRNTSVFQPTPFVSKLTHSFLNAPVFFCSFLPSCSATLTGPAPPPAAVLVPSTA